MILQEGINFEKYARCICLGQQHIKVIHYEPGNPFHLRYVVDDNEAFFGKELHDRIVKDARTLTSALGYDMDTNEFAIRDGVPYAIDWLNPAPDMDYYSVTPTYFEWVVENMADLVIDRALNGYTPGGHFRWDRFLDAAPPPMGTPVKNWTDFAHEDVRGTHAEVQAKSRASRASNSKAKVKNGAASMPQPVPDAETTP